MTKAKKLIAVGMLGAGAVVGSTYLATRSTEPAVVATPHVGPQLCPFGRFKDGRPNPYGGSRPWCVDESRPAEEDAGK